MFFALGRSWVSLVALESLLGRLGSLLGCLGVVLGCLGSLLGLRGGLKNAMFVDCPYVFSMVFALGPSWSLLIVLGRS